MKIHIIIKDKIKNGYVRAAISEYEKRLSRYAKIKLKINSKFEKAINKKSYVIAIGKKGDMLSSEELADRLSSVALEGNSHIVFVHDNDSYKEADLNLSISKMDIDKDLMLIILYEQIYRAYSIINKTPYHK